MFLRSQMDTKQIVIRKREMFELRSVVRRFNVTSSVIVIMTKLFVLRATNANIHNLDQLILRYLVLGKEVCPFEFLEILCGSALVFINKEILRKFHPVEEGEYSEVLPAVEFSPSKSMEEIEDDQKMNEEQVEEIFENSGMHLFNPNCVSPPKTNCVKEILIVTFRI